MRVIGITCGVGAEWRLGGSSYRTYASAMERAGAVCRPLGHGRRAQLDDCHGLLVPGGWDIHPRRYQPMPGDEGLAEDEMMSRYRITCETMRDALELRLIRRALEAGKPILAICRGVQALNVALAGKLVPDIATCVPGALTHRSVGTGPSLAHEVEIEPDSLVGRAYRTKSLTVNTRHHQGILPDMIPEGFRVTALAPDGVVEAIECADGRFAVGVQWHPERKNDPFIYDLSGPLFEAFVEACRR